MSNFTTPCYIHIDTPELRAKLEDMGYIPTIPYNVNLPYLAINGTLYCQLMTIDYLRQSRFYDCGKNEQLFLALAALRKDSDFMQWFNCGEKSDSWFLCTWEKVEDFIPNEMDGWDVSGHKKATELEIIEKFKAE